MENQRHVNRWESLSQTLTATQVAELLHVDRDTVYKALRAGRIPAQRIGRVWRIDREMLRTWWEGSRT